MPRISKFKFFRKRKRPSTSGGSSGGSGTPPPPPDPSDQTLGWSGNDITARRTELQSGEAKIIFQNDLDWLDEILNRTAPTPGTKGNYYSVDATSLAEHLADISALEPEHASWTTAGVIFPTKINTKQKCVDLSIMVWRWSTWRGDRVDSTPRTSPEFIQLITSGNRTTFTDGDGTHPPHIWLFPCSITTATLYLIDKIYSLVTVDDRTALADAALHLLNVGMGDIPGFGSNYPQICGEEGWNNQSFSQMRFLGPPGMHTLLGKNVTDATGETNIATIETKFKNRTLEEVKVYNIDDVPAPGFHESSGTGYAGDNMGGLARLALWTSPILDWFESGLVEFISKCPEVLYKECLPHTFGTWPGRSVRYGTNGDTHSNLAELPMNIALLAAALNRLGYSTAAGQLKWLHQNSGIAYTDIGGAELPSDLLQDQFRVAWNWYIIMGKMADITAIPITSFSTAKSALGFRVWNNVLAGPGWAANPTAGILYYFASNEILYYGHAQLEWQTGKTVLWAYGGYVNCDSIGSGKSGFGYHGQQNSMPFILFNEAFFQANRSLSAHPLSANLSNANAAFEKCGERYADDPDNIKGGYVGFNNIRYASNVIPNDQWQIEVFAFIDKGFFVEFHKCTVVTPSTMRLLIPKITPTKPTFLDGSGEVRTHMGRWISDGGRTLEMTNDSGGSFSALHRGQTQTWPDAHNKAYISIRTTHDLEVQIRGYDPDYINGAQRDNLEHQVYGTIDDDKMGRGMREVRRGVASCYTTADVVNGVAANRRIYIETFLDDDQVSQPVTDADLAVTFTHLAYGNGSTLPTYRTKSSVDTTTTPKSVIVTADTTINIANKQNVSLTTGATELATDFQPAADPIANGVKVRRILGGWSIWACARQGFEPTRSEIFWCTQVTDSRAAASRAIVTQYEEADVTHIEAGTPVNIVVVIPRTHLSITNSALWLNGYDFLLHTLTVDVTCVGLIPGTTYNITSAVEGANRRITLASTGGSRVVNSEGRITFSVSAGNIV